MEGGADIHLPVGTERIGGVPVGNLPRLDFFDEPQFRLGDAVLAPPRRTSAIALIVRHDRYTSNARMLGLLARKPTAWAGEYLFDSARIAVYRHIPQGHALSAPATFVDVRPNSVLNRRLGTAPITYCPV